MCNASELLKEIQGPRFLQLFVIFLVGIWYLVPCPDREPTKRPGGQNWTKMRKNRASSVVMRIFLKREGYFSRAVSLDEISSCGLCRYAILDAFQYYPQYAWSCAFFRNILAFSYFARIFIFDFGNIAVIFTIVFVKISTNTIQIWESICCKNPGD